MTLSRTLRLLAGLLILGVVLGACAVWVQEPTLKVRPATISVCTGETRALTTSATGKDLSFAWTGAVSGKLEHPGGPGDQYSSNHYTAPGHLGEDTIRDTIFVTVTDGFGRTATDTALITINCTPTPPPQPPIITDPRAGDPVDMNITVSGATPKGTPPPGTNLYVLVKPRGLDYWLQPTPEVGPTGWRGEAGVGQDRDGGQHFFICSILTVQDLQKGWHAVDPPPGEAHCIDVIRKTPTPTPSS